jgi:hemolysin III
MKIKDPFSGLSHLLGLILSIIGTIFLLYFAYKQNDPIKIFSFLVFGLSMILLYGSSSFYHLFGHSAEEIDIFRKMDHAMIYVLIAGTYTPLCLLGIKGTIGISATIVIWIIALFGIGTVFFKSFWKKTPRWFATFLYILMGWLSMIIIYPLYKAVGIEIIILLLTGGFFYTVGAIIYAIKKPNIHKNFGFHDLFHVFVLLGTIIHFYCIYSYLTF